MPGLGSRERPGCSHAEAGRQRRLRGGEQLPAQRGPLCALLRTYTYSCLPNICPAPPNRETYDFPEAEVMALVEGNSK